MAHLGNSFTAAEAFNGLATDFYATDLVALNSSGASGSVLASYYVEEDGSGYINVALSAQGLAPGAHVQHIHGTFDEDGNPTDAQTPTLGNDADRDGVVEVLEGVPAYGDVLMPVQGPDGSQPTADASGNLFYVQSFDIQDAANFFSPVTGAQYTFSDVMDLALREYVIHGVVVPPEIGAGTGGEVDGTQNGLVPILPAAAGEFDMISGSDALAAINGFRADASDEIRLDDAGNFFDGGYGDDTISGRGGADTLYGGADNDRIDGGSNNDMLFGGSERDALYGRSGNDLLVGGDGDDALFGGSGDDIFGGLLGDDRLTGGSGRDEFHFDAGTGADRITDFTQGEDVISFLDDGAISFANSNEDASARGDSDLSADDFAMVDTIAMISASEDQKVVYTDSEFSDMRNGTGAAAEAYVVGTDGIRTAIAYDDDWSTTEGRELIAVLQNFGDMMTASDFDVY
ncbi:calcium-binding protein [Wenxinia marina]|uniref:Alkaline phosphatase n=1 Tax=Wenxinia marina DSM 24838 TaxID=1123501 RepID=A0A0D0NTA4_9RHOB|nr:hypothetical protein [Wenxinia marina]KIQ71430.1 Alkaline phosphatase [Wenxinia marina DSM 24838]GGL78943.1 hypothetical protein GCM10011392_36790 [Wenxinia marina]